VLFSANKLVICVCRLATVWINSFCYRLSESSSVIYWPPTRS